MPDTEQHIAAATKGKIMSIKSTDTEMLTAKVLADPGLTRRYVTWMVTTGAYLTAKAEWEMEDNFYVAETLAEMTRWLFQDTDHAVTVAEEGGHDIDPGNRA